MASDNREGLASVAREAWERGDECKAERAAGAAAAIMNDAAPLGALAYWVGRGGGESVGGAAAIEGYAHGAESRP